MKLVKDSVINCEGIRIVDLDDVKAKIEEYEAYPIFNSREVIREMYLQLKHRENEIEDIRKIVIKFNLDCQVLTELKDCLVHIFYVDLENQNRWLLMSRVHEFTNNCINQVAAIVMNLLSEKVLR